MTPARIKNALDGGELTPAEVASIAGVTTDVAEQELEKFAERGEVLRPEQGVFRSI